MQLNTLELQALEAKLKLLEQKEKRLSRGAGILPTSPIVPGAITESGAPSSNDSTGAITPNPRDLDPNHDAPEQTKSRESLTASGNGEEYVVVNRRDVVVVGGGRKSKVIHPPPPVQEYDDEDEDEEDYDDGRK